MTETNDGQRFSVKLKQTRNSLNDAALEMVINMPVGPTRFATAHVTDVSSPAQDLWAESYREASEEC